MNAPSVSRFPTFLKAGAFIARVTAASARLTAAGARRGRRIFLSRTSLKVYLITATLICLTYTSLRWVGRRALKAEKARVAALGMATEWNQLAPQPPLPPEAQNFLTAPVFAGIFQPPYPKAPHLKMWFNRAGYPIKDIKGRIQYKYFIRPKIDSLAAWSSELRKFGELPDPPRQSTPAAELLADHRWDATIQAVYAASARPYARYPAQPSQFPSGIMENRVDVMRPFMRGLQLHARAQLETGNASQAVPALRVTHHLIEASVGGPYSRFDMAGYLRGQKILLLTGMVSHQWPVAALEDMAQAAYPTKIVEAAHHDLQRERLSQMNLMENYQTTIFPRLQKDRKEELLWKYAMPDWTYMQASIRLSKHLTAWHETTRPLMPNESWPGRIQQMPEPVDLDFGPLKFLGYVGYTDRLRDHQYWSYINPVFEATLQHLAVRLEIHFLEHGAYPASLTELDSKLPANALIDIDGQPLRYTTNGVGTLFTLLSVGWDGVLDPLNAPEKNDLVYSTDPERLPK